MAGKMRKLVEGIGRPFGATGYNLYLLRMLKRPEWIYAGRGRIPQIPLTFMPPNAVTDADLAIADRLLTAYRKTTADFPKVTDRSPIWFRNIQHHSQALIHALGQSSPALLASQLASMFRSEFLHGIASGHLYSNAGSRLGARIWSWKCLDDLVSLAESLGAIRTECPEQGTLAHALTEGPSALVTRIESALGMAIGFPPVGAPYGFSVGTALVTMESPEHLYAAWRLCEAVKTHMGIRSKDPLHIAEIGGGFGGTAYWLLRMNRLRFSHYTLIDLPVFCVLQGYFLSKALGESRVVLYGETRQPEPGTFSVRVIPGGALNEITDSVDVLLNQNSLPEIPEATGMEYLRWAKERVRGIFFSYNQEAFSPVEGIVQALVPEIATKTGGFCRLSRSASWLRRGYVEEVYTCARGGD